VEVFCVCPDVDDSQVLYVLEASDWLRFNWTNFGEALFDDGRMVWLCMIGK
jgi:hypothetical protein